MKYQDLKEKKWKIILKVYKWQIDYNKMQNYK